jgi:hypothetical protein
MSRKPKKCPECGSGSIAEILYGLPAYDEQMERDLDASKIVLGGCCVSDDSPEWHCNECEHKWGRKLW